MQLYKKYTFARGKLTGVFHQADGPAAKGRDENTGIYQHAEESSIQTHTHVMTHSNNHLKSFTQPPLPIHRCVKVNDAVTLTGLIQGDQEVPRAMEVEVAIVFPYFDPCPMEISLANMISIHCCRCFQPTNYT